MDSFAGAEIDAFAGHAHLLPLVAGEMHLDTLALAIVEGVMLEAVEIEFPVNLAVNPYQEVEIERLRHAGGIVIGRVENTAVLLQIGADDQRRAAAKDLCRIAQESSRLVRLKVADRRAGEKADADCRHRRGQIKR